MFHIFNDILKGSKILESVEQRNIGRGGSENKRYYFITDASKLKKYGQ